MHPGLSVFLFQIISIRHWKLKLNAQLGWKARTLSHEEMLQFQNPFSFCVKMKLQTFQNTFTKDDERCKDRGTLLGCDVRRCHCFPDSAASRAGAQPLLGTGYSGLKTEFSLAWHPQAISVLAFMIHKQHSDFAGQMRSFCLWLLVKQPYLDFFQVSWNKYWNSEKSLGLARLEFDFVPWTSDSLGKPLLQITLHFLLWLKRRCERTCELTYGSLLAECLPKCVWRSSR